MRKEKLVRRIMASILVIGAFMMVGITEHVGVVHAQTAKVNKPLPPTFLPQVKVKLKAAAGTSICPAGVLHCVILSWTPGPTPPAQLSFNVYRSATPGACLAGATPSATPSTAAGCTKIGSVTAPTTTYTDSPLSASTSYSYVVAAENTSGESLPSNEWTTTTQADPVPNAPTGLSGQSQ